MEQVRDHRQQACAGRTTRPSLGIGVPMPCFAYSPDGVLLLARGERINGESQLARLTAADVIFSDLPPAAPRRRAALHEPVALRQLTPGESAPADETRGARANAVERREPAEPGAGCLSPLQEGVGDACRVGDAAGLCLEQAVARVQAGRELDLGSVQEIVRRMLTSLDRDPASLSRLVYLRSLRSDVLAHSVNTCVLAVLLARQHGLGHRTVEVGKGALLHDLGRFGAPGESGGWDDGLPEVPRRTLRLHTLRGIDLLGGGQQVGPLVFQAVSQHHERVDGSGYPLGLSGEAIGLGGRITAIADAYDTLCSPRSSPAAVLPAEAMSWILSSGGHLFDPDLTRSFAKAIGLYPVGSLVRLSTGELAIVARANPAAVAAPIVAVVSTPSGSPLEVPYLTDLSTPSLLRRRRSIVQPERPSEVGVDVDRYLDGANTETAASPGSSRTPVRQEAMAGSVAERVTSRGEAVSAVTEGTLGRV